MRERVLNFLESAGGLIGNKHTQDCITVRSPECHREALTFHVSSFSLHLCKNNLHLKPGFSRDTPLCTRVKKKRAFDRNAENRHEENLVSSDPATSGCSILLAIDVLIRYVNFHVRVQYTIPIRYRAMRARVARVVASRRVANSMKKCHRVSG